jgi:hypothetical protein
MSLRLIKPGMRHPKTNALIEPLYVRKNGSVVWPVIGASSDDVDDPDFTGEGEDDDSEDDDSEEDDSTDQDDKKKPSKKKTKSSDDDEDDEEDDEEDSRVARASRQAKNYRLKLREAEKANREMAARIKAIEDKDKKPEEIVSRDIAEAKAKAEKAEHVVRQTRLENAFLRANTVDWVDSTDAFKLIDLDDVDVDEDGTVDERQLARALRALAKRKPHLVKKAKASGSADENNDDDSGQGSTTRQMNGTRRGSRDQKPTREQLAKKFPVIGRL